MIVLKDLPSMTDQDLKAITRAIYVVKCTNGEFPNLYSCGAAGVRSGQNGNLFQRLESHARVRRSHRQSNGNQLYRHEVSPFEIRVWALHLVSWTELGVQLAEHVLHFRLSLAFPFVAESCFLAQSNSDVLKAVEAMVSDLGKIVVAGNSSAGRNNILQELQVVPI